MYRVTQRLILAALLMFTFVDSATAIDAYLVAGQSNGWRMSHLRQGSVPKEGGGAARVHYFGMKCVSEPDASDLQTLTALHPNTMGYGLAQGLLQQAGGKDIVFIQFCRCGAPVLAQNAKSWYPGDDPASGRTYDDGLFGKFANYIANARKQVKDRLGEELEFKGVFWHQGESDASHDKVKYQQAMRGVFWRIRDLLGVRDLPIVAGHIRDLGEGPRGVNAALDQIAASDPNIDTVPLDGLQFEADRNGHKNVHIALPGCHGLGRRMVAAWQSMVRVDTSFHVYLPSRESRGLLHYHAKREGNELKLHQKPTIELGGKPMTIVKHPTLSKIYVAGGRDKQVGIQGAVVSLDSNGSYASHKAVDLLNQYCFLSVDRSNRYLLGVDYGGGFVDVFSLDEQGMLGDRVAGLNEGRNQAHCVWPSPDNRFVYIPYVKDSNGLFQYRFDARSGSLSPLTPKNANPPEGTGPRHLAYHSSLPIVYFSNEQHLGVSVYDIAESGQLKIRQVCDAVDPARSKDGLSSSDIVITPDGRYLFAGIRGHRQDLDRISRYRIKANGDVEHIGLTEADKIPWGLALSPNGRYLLVTAFKGNTLTAYEIGDDGSLKKAASVPCDGLIMDVVTAGG